MTEFEVGEHKYRTRPLDAFRQFHVARRLVPVLGEMAKVFSGDERPDPMSSLTMIGTAISAMSDADADYILRTCLGACEREGGGGTGWTRVSNSAGDLQYEDIGLPVMLQLCWHVVEENLGGFFAAVPPNLGAGGQATAPSIS